MNNGGEAAEIDRPHEWINAPTTEKLATQTENIKK